ncbi:hypothetical protein GQE99_18600 [Maritimibacter sp. DP07]|uniref:Uncharacterized protein n=1 Tax=Maritimibacter harenae TaxID=2606218 RepID=A0A845MBC8_9RHOB|nr:hypothetical protein [Maritimibacter harenae]MZR15034.1 hypothetical protein [Maritimibacter harenae]
MRAIEAARAVAHVCDAQASDVYQWARILTKNGLAPSAQETINAQEIFDLICAVALAEREGDIVGVVNECQRLKMLGVPSGNDDRQEAPRDLFARIFDKSESLGCFGIIFAKSAGRPYVTFRYASPARGGREFEVMTTFSTCTSWGAYSRWSFEISPAGIFVLREMWIARLNVGATAPFEELGQ